MALTHLESGDSDDSMVSSSKSHESDSHDDFVIRELLMNGLSLSRVIKIYKERLSEDDIVTIARSLLIEIGSKRDEEGLDEEDSEATGLIGNCKISRNQHFCAIGIDILRRLPCDLSVESELLGHHIANLSQSAPEDFFDPIFSHIMSDPVVISSGFVVDRSTAIKEESGDLKFKSCPWSREPLDRKVYPALRLKQQMTEFKSGRVGEMLDTASLLLNAKNERDFCKVIDLAQEFIEDIGPKGHRALAFKLANLGLQTLDFEPSDISKLCILQPSLLTKQFLMLYELKPTNFLEAYYMPITAVKMSGIAQKAIDAKQFEEAEKWLACCDQIQDQCRDMLTGEKEIPVAQMRLGLAKKRGDENLVPFQRGVYLGYLRDGKTAAAQKFLEDEGIGSLDLRDLSPCFFEKGAFTSDISNDAWHEGCRSFPLEGEVSHVFATAHGFSDQGWGNVKGNLALALYSNDDELVARCNLYGTYRTAAYTSKFPGDDAYRLLEADQEVVAKCKPGYYYKLEFTVGGGGGHRLILQSFTCKIFYKEWFEESPSTGCYRMHDPEGDAGVFLGSVNDQGVANGKGRLEYDDGITFIGTFADGLMLEGTNYHHGKAVHTMVGGSWTPGSDLGNPNKTVVARFPLDSNNITHNEDE